MMKNYQKLKTPGLVEILNELYSMTAEKARILARQEGIATFYGTTDVPLDVVIQDLAINLLQKRYGIEAGRWCHKKLRSINGAKGLPTLQEIEQALKKVQPYIIREEVKKRGIRIYQGRTNHVQSTSALRSLLAAKLYAETQPPPQPIVPAPAPKPQAPPPQPVVQPQPRMTYGQIARQMADYLAQLDVHAGCLIGATVLDLMIQQYARINELVVITVGGEPLLVRLRRSTDQRARISSMPAPFK